MIIDSSAVGMTANRKYSSMSQVQSETLVTTADEAKKLAGTLKEGMNTKDAVEQLHDAEKELKAEKKQREKENIAKTLKNITASNAANIKRSPVRSIQDFKTDILKIMLKALSKDKKALSLESSLGGFSTLTGFSSMKAAYQQSASFEHSNISILAGSSDVTIANGSKTVPTVWKQTTANSVFFAETENTQFSASGVARTADGREINFGVDIEMSRGFCAKYSSFTQQDYVCTDPLVINLDSNIANVTDQKFLFDLDSDGKSESMSFTAPGSGFLAIDKNGDGVINNGSELFGTKSGDGFADLAAYDQDGNGWIDEADDVFKDLKIWTKDENGKDHLLSLKEAGVGALYLGSNDTEFSLNNKTTNETNGIIRKTGVYLKENGQVGTMQHVDLAT